MWKDKRFLYGILTGFGLVGLYVFFLVLVSLFGFLGDGGVGEKGNVGVVKVEGVIRDAQKTLEQLDTFLEEDRIKAIVLRVDSPGGGIAPSQEIHDYLEEIREKKPVVASFGNVAASGGYYISVPAQKIVASPGTVTGSIGVITKHLILKDVVDKLHLRWEIFKSGKIKDIGSPLRESTPEEQRLLQGLVDHLHLQFVSAIAKGRKLKEEEVAKLADGRIFSGAQAKKLKLIDELGGLKKAIKLAGELGKVEGEAKAEYNRKAKKWYQFLLEEGADSFLQQVYEKSQLNFAYR